MRQFKTLQLARFYWHSLPLLSRASGYRLEGQMFQTKLLCFVSLKPSYYSYDLLFRFSRFMTSDLLNQDTQSVGLVRQRLA